MCENSSVSSISAQRVGKNPLKVRPRVEFGRTDGVEFCAIHLHAVCGRFSSTESLAAPERSALRPTKARIAVKLD